jgi:2-keto-4-pentenoate hydratase/2-oxohepta-3-ene-1,7-dioic acid hydratase in catechol pathway
MRWTSFQYGVDEAGYGVATDSGIVNVAAFPDAPASMRQAIAAGRLAELGREAAARQPDLAYEAIRFVPLIPDADKIVAVGRNYKSHVAEMARDVPENPRTFIRHMSSLVGHLQPIIRPKVSERFDYEGELAVVIGHTCRHVAPAEALSVIAGYTLMNDGSVRDYQGHSLNAGKNFYRSGSLGPWMVEAASIPDPTDLLLTTRVNGEEVQRSRTDLLLYDIPQIIAYVSAWTELQPGDVIATGTPGGVGQSRTPPLWLKPGDTVEIEIDRIGVLRNEVVAE